MAAYGATERSGLTTHDSGLLVGTNDDSQGIKHFIRRHAGKTALTAAALGFVGLAIIRTTSRDQPQPDLHKYVPKSHFELEPFSTLDPQETGMLHVERPESSQPGPIWGKLRNQSISLQTSLPTNAWWENLVLGTDTDTELNGVAAIPYTIDPGETAGSLRGIRVHHPRVFAASDLIVTTSFDSTFAVYMSSVEPVQHHTVAQPGQLAITLEWPSGDDLGKVGMRTPIVRGSPYATMEYYGLSPVISAPLQDLVPPLLVDGEEAECNNGTITVQREIVAQFDKSDHTWMVFVNGPLEFQCSSHDGFRLTATSPLHGAVRTALANNCTAGSSYTNCDVNERGERQARDQSEFTQILRRHAMVYPTDESHVSYQLPDDKRDEDAVTSEEKATLRFSWHTRRLDDVFTDFPEQDEPTSLRPWKHGGWSDQQGPVAPIMYSLPHHREHLHEGAQILDAGATPTLHGMAKLISGDAWELTVRLHPVSFNGPRPVRKEMRDAVNKALDDDLDFDMPENYKVGAGDTYFSGKILAKMARIALIAHDMGRKKEALKVVDRLKMYAQVWYNGSSEDPLLYDTNWGGVVSCGCNYQGDEENNTYTCDNEIGPGCPALNDVGQNFGLGFYNDHHFHYGYHIYAAAAIAKFDPAWGMKYHDAVMLLVRDIANPSHADPFFPVFRQKDWFLGSSWALGIPTLGGVPYRNGRNQESSSEAVNAYDAVALYGDVMSQVFAKHGDHKKAASCAYVRRTGRMLTATELRSAQVYWHVRSPDTPGVQRVYPVGYRPHVVGMLWSTLAQLQTWFGAEAWKVYGIQILPLTAVSEQLLDYGWVEEMLDEFSKSCLEDTNPAQLCIKEGWSTLVFACQAIIGDWRSAWSNVTALPDHAFETAGGNGHSRTNTLWWVGTRG